MANLSNINNKFLVTTGGNVLIGKTAANNATVGTQIMSAGDINPTVSGDTVARFNRLSTDGEIIRLQKDTSTVGSIGSTTSYLLGDLGIGIATPSKLLHLYGADATVQIQGLGTSSDAGVNFFPRDGSNVAHLQSIKGVGSSLTFLTGGNSGNSYVPTERMRIDSSGIVKINTTAVNARFRVDEGRTSEWVAGFKHTGTTPYGVFIDTSGNTSGGYTLGCYTNTGTGLFLKNDGKVGIGTTSPDNKLDVRNGELTVRPSSSGNGGLGKIGHSSNNAILQLYDSSGNEDVRISTSLSSYFNGGNVGIGTTLPATKLDVTGTDNGDTVRIANTGTYGGTISFNQGSGNTNIGYVGSLRAFEGNASGDNGIGLYSRDRISFYTSSTTPDLTIADNGNVGIGLDPVYKLDVRGERFRLNPNSNGLVLTDMQNDTGSFYFGIDNTTGSSFGGANSARTIYSQGAYPMAFWTNNAERMRIDSIGRMGFNSGIETDTRHYFYSNNNTGAATGVARNIKIKSTQYAGTHVQFVGSQGNGGTIGYSNLTASYNTTGSDERLKKNITNWNENILDKFKDIKPKEFHFNQQEDSEEKQKGYIAQNEVDKFPEAYPLLYDDVSKEDRHQFNPSGMVVYLMKAIQELKAEIDELKK